MSVSTFLSVAKTESTATGGGSVEVIATINYDQSGERKTGRVDVNFCQKNKTITLNGKPVELKDLKMGDTIILDGEPAVGVKATRAKK
jgi:hypothetical protein